ncbi:formimidoylglutamate deiminase [Inquilinus limosus]|uniref:formimidoylglutamate deiminase n=1 Tax=Inquilinus limosus TaxID=171674 RepID=UPI00042A013F|nr:formimidoylglutamate deiminase [Inquilinus limosus]
MTTRYFAETALLADGWADDVLIEIDAKGDISSVAAGAGRGDAEAVAGVVLPGMANLHSHAFQRAMAGLAETAAGPGDDFWSWREQMYRFVRVLDPDQVEAIAAQLYVEMLKAGYTCVAEFHYLHHQPDGAPYADRAELSRRVIAAAKATGIGITHLPVLYATGGFGGQPAGEGQRRFLNDVDGILDIAARLRADHAGDLDVRIGIAPHSLRAVTPEMLAAVVDGTRAADPAAPIHIHIAEQVKEVEQCLAWSGTRPVEWLLGHAAVDGRWCLVHATHLTGAETAALAASGAVAGLCPTTEANLGDGLFPLAPYLAAGGRLGIGSDSHISVGVIEELRWLEYGQRLAHRKRGIGAGPGRPSVGATLFQAAIDGGARAVGRASGRIEAGARADLVVLDPDHPALVGRRGDALLDSFVFAGNESPIRHVMAGGRWRVRDGHHADEAAVAARYRKVMAALLA